MFRNFGWPEIVLILVIILIIFGVGKLPQVGGAIGKAIRNFRNAQKGEFEEDKDITKKADEKNDSSSVKS